MKVIKKWYKTDIKPKLLRVYKKVKPAIDLAKKIYDKIKRGVIAFIKEVRK